MKASLSAITEKIGALFDIRKGEFIKTFSLFLYLLLVITSYVVSKTVRDALFLTKFGALKLPYVYIGIAVIASLFVAVYIQIARRVKQNVLLSLTLLFFASNAILFWWLSRFHFEWLFPVIYIWAGVFGVIAPMQVWTLSNYIMTTREAKRLYGFIGSGGVLGAIAGGFFSSWMVSIIGTESLLLSIAGFMIICVFLVNLIWYKSAKNTIEINQKNESEKDDQTESPSNLIQSLSIIRRSRYLILIAAIISVSSIATTIIDYQFKAVAQNSLSSKDELTAFFGNFYGYVGIAAFLLQITLTSKIMRKLGIGFTIFLLPIGLVLGSVTLLIYLTLWSAVAMRVPDQLFKHSIDKSTIELLYLPLPIRIKGAVKSFIDTVIWRIADGTAGLILLLLTSALSFSIREISMVNLVILSIWIAIAYAAKKEYVEALRSSIVNPENVEALLEGQKEETARSLDGVNSRKTFSSLQTLAIDGGEQSIKNIESLLEHESPVVRAKAIVQLFNKGN
jgi:ATP:ADP antiporter, AAA family